MDVFMLETMDLSMIQVNFALKKLSHLIVVVAY